MIDGTITLNYTVNDRQATGLAGTVNIPVAKAPTVTFTNGTGAAQGTAAFPGLRTLTGAPDLIDLTMLIDAHGNPINLASVKGFYVRNLDPAHPIVVGNAGSNPWGSLLNATGTITLPPGAWFGAATPDAAGWAVGGTSKILEVAGTAGTQYEVGILGHT